MTRKPRRSKKPDKSASDAPTEPRSTEAPGEAEGKGASRRDEIVDTDGPRSGATEDDQAKPGKLGKLPAFGFASDLLAAGKSSAPPDSDPEEPAESDDPTGSETDVSAPAPSAAMPTKGAAAGPDRIFRFADSLEREEEEEAEVAQRITTWITFSLADEIFALPVEPVREVLRVSHITRVPHAPRPIRGVTNLRGRVIPIIDLRVRIELPAAEIDRSSRAIVVGSRGRLIGLMVDAVHQVAHIDLNRVQPPPDDVMTVQSDYLYGVHQQDDRLILLLDVDRALIIRESEPEETEAGAA